LSESAEIWSEGEVYGGLDMVEVTEVEV